jgi:uncharacterized protein (TIGR03546 family)
MKFKIKALFKKLLRLNNTPEEIALGVAVGIFIGVTPLYGFHTTIVVLLSMLIPRTNKIAILASSNISIPPTAPFISWAGYEIGRLILGSNYPAISWSMLKKFTYQSIADILYPLFLGSFVLGLIASVISYFLILLIIRKTRWTKGISNV